LRPDNSANKKLYGKRVSARSIVLENAVATPTSAEKLISALNQCGKKPQKRRQAPGHWNYAARGRFSPGYRAVYLDVGGPVREWIRNGNLVEG
jgi:hypothetical protein